MIRFCRILPVLAAAFSPLSAQAPLLSLDFNNFSVPGFQPSPLFEAAFHGDFAISSSTPGIGNFASTGFLVVPQFKTPTGPFTVEAVFRLRAYGTDAGTFSTVLLNASEGGQGFSLKVGGGPRYPILPGTDHVQPSIWAQSLEASDRNRSLVSTCVGAFSMLGPNGQVLEAYTKTCLQLGEWVHLTATWDGSAIHLYVNGEEATDANRMMGLGSYPLRPDQIPVFVGVQDVSGGRHFNGEMDFVRVLDGALKGAEILQRFKESDRTEDPAYACQGAVTPKPVVVQGACDLAYSKLTLNGNDSMEVQLAVDWDFRTLVTRYRVPVKFYRYFDHYNRIEAENDWLFWRATLVRGPVPVPPEPPPVVTVPPVTPPDVTLPPVTPPVVTVPPVTPPVVTIPPDTTPLVSVPPDTTPIVSAPSDTTRKVTLPQDTTPRIPTRILARNLAWTGNGAIQVPYVAGAEILGLYRLDGIRIPAVVVRMGGVWELRPKSAEPGLVLVRQLKVAKAAAMSDTER